MHSHKKECLFVFGLILVVQPNAAMNKFYIFLSRRKIAGLILTVY